MTRDKLLHIVVSSAIVVVLGLLMPIWVAALAALGVGIAKEVYDKISGKGCFEWMDIICDCIGILIGVL